MNGSGGQPTHDTFLEGKYNKLLIIKLLSYLGDQLAYLITQYWVTNYKQGVHLGDQLTYIGLTS